MKLLNPSFVFLASISRYKSTLYSTCSNDNLLVHIPYPDEPSAKILSLEAGNCTEEIFDNGATLNYDSVHTDA